MTPRRELSDDEADRLLASPQGRHPAPTVGERLRSIGLLADVMDPVAT